MTDLLDHFVAGMRLALMVLATMMLLTRVTELPSLSPAELDQLRATERRWNAFAWSMVALSAVLFSALRVLRLYGRPAPHVLTRFGEMMTTGVAGAAFILVIAARGVLRGLSISRVRRGALANVLLAITTTVIACLLR